MLHLQLTSPKRSPPSHVSMQMVEWLPSILVSFNAYIQSAYSPAAVLGELERYQLIEWCYLLFVRSRSIYGLPAVWIPRADRGVVLYNLARIHISMSRWGNRSFGNSETNADNGTQHWTAPIYCSCPSLRGSWQLADTQAPIHCHFTLVVKRLSTLDWTQHYKARVC